MPPAVPPTWRCGRSGRHHRGPGLTVPQRRAGPDSRANRLPSSYVASQAPPAARPAGTSLVREGRGEVWVGATPAPRCPGTVDLDDQGRPVQQQYLDLLQRVLDEGAGKGDRTGTGARSACSADQMRFDLPPGSPADDEEDPHWPVCARAAVVPARRHQRAVASGPRHRSGTSGPTTTATSGRSTATSGAVVADGPTAGTSTDRRSSTRSAQPRLPPAPHRDRLERRRHPVEMALPATACSSSTSRRGPAPCQLYQRSADVFLGVPFNIASLRAAHPGRRRVTEVSDFIHHLRRRRTSTLNHLDQASA